jgi:hypothetical protein
MIRIAVFTALWLMPGLARGQEVISRRSNPLSINMPKDKACRTPFRYSQVNWVDDDQSGSIEPGEEGYVCFTIANPAGADSKRLYVTARLAEPVPGLQLPGLIRLHPVEAGKKMVVQVPLRATTALAADVATLLIETREASIFEADLLQVQLLTSGGGLLTNYE